MTVIDPTSSIGKIRLRTGDWSDLPILPDAVIQSALDDCSGNMPKSAALCAQYILATLTRKTHRKLSTLEVWGKEQFDSYVKFIQLTILNPNLANVAPIPYSGEGRNTMQEFVDDWQKCYYNGSESQSLALSADFSPNDGSRTGGYWGGF